MRLTLRTLLAYLDDMLSPADAKEIGGKIAESEPASQMIARIRDVMRRRRLTAPEVLGPASGVDPNLVAEYLDNLLTPEQITQIEQICHDSDMHLAEVAGSHQILTIVLGDPIEIDQHSRERMYALGPGLGQRTPNAGGAAAAAAAASPAPQNSAQAPAPTQAGEGGTFEERIPEYLRQNRSFGGFWPILLVGLLLAVWVGLVVFDGDDPAVIDDDTIANLDNDTEGTSDPSSTGGDDPDSDTNPEPTPPVVDNGPLDPLPPDDDTTVAGGAVGDMPPVGDGLPDVPAPPVDPMPTEVASNTNPNTAPDLTAVPDPPIAGANDPNPPETPADPPQALGPAIEGIYQSQSGVLLEYDEDADEWKRIRTRSAIRPGDILATPEPFTSVFELDKGKRLTLTALGGSQFRVLRPDEFGPDSVAGLELLRGRFVFVVSQGGDEPGVIDLAPVDPDAPPADVANGPSLLVTLKLGAHDWKCVFQGEQVRAGIELRNDPPLVRGVIAGPNWYRGIAGVWSGAVTLTDHKQESHVVSERGVVALDASVDPPVSPDTALVVVPEWIEGRTPVVTPQVRSIQTKFENEFGFDFSATENVMPLVRDGSSVRLAEYAVQTLALVESINELAEALVEAPAPEARMLAADSIRAWLPRAKENDARLMNYLRKTYTDDKPDILHALLWGVTADQASSRTFSERMVKWLEHPSPTVRELTIRELARLVGKTNGYEPSANFNSRRSSVMRWQQHVEENGALVPKL